MEKEVGLGSIGSLDAKLSKGMASIEIKAEVDLTAELQKVADKASNDLEKAALAIVIGLLKAMD